MKTLFFILLSILLSQPLEAADITGVIHNSINSPIAQVSIAIRISHSLHPVAEVVSQSDGSFKIQGLASGNYTIACSHIGYMDYIAELHIEQEENITLGTLTMQPKEIELSEVVVSSLRNIFTANKQTIYPSKLQTESSGNSLELLQKLPIPLIDVNPIRHTINPIGQEGDVAIFINDIPATVDELSAINPKQVLRIDVIRKPGVKYGKNLSMAINIFLKDKKNGISMGANIANSITLRNGNNNISFIYCHGKSQWSINQNINYQNNSRQKYEESRQYLLPNDSWHEIAQQSISARTLLATYNTTFKYNYTKQDNLVIQLQGNLNWQHNPKQKRVFQVYEKGDMSYIYQTNRSDQYTSSGINIYLKKYLHKNQTLAFNAVGTQIQSDYNYSNIQNSSVFSTRYNVMGKKFSIIGELKYSKEFTWGNFTSGMRYFYGRVKNQYTESIDKLVMMTNSNSSAYAQLDWHWKKLSGNVTLTLEDQYYKQQEDSYQKYSFIPLGGLLYSFNSNMSIGYNFSLASRLPSLASLNDITYQIDQWERRVGNSKLKPFNHVAHTFTATYHTQRWHMMLSGVHINNKNAIMPIIYRTETPGQTFFDNGTSNGRDMRQWVLTAYLRYSALQNKLILSGTGIYNHYHADSQLYSKSKGFFYGNLQVESYLGKFFLSANIHNRYNSLFAETIWYNEYASAINVLFKWKACQIGITWEQPFQHGTNSRIETRNNFVKKITKQYQLESSNHILFRFSWNFEHGIKSKSQGVDLNNKDSDTGIFK